MSSLPTYATDGASGMDLRAFIDEPVILAYGGGDLFRQDYLFKFQGYEGQVRARSGLVSME